jgi:hypothetical protein
MCEKKFVFWTRNSKLSGNKATFRLCLFVTQIFYSPDNETEIQVGKPIPPDKQTEKQEGKHIHPDKQTEIQGGKCMKDLVIHKS